MEFDLLTKDELDEFLNLANTHRVKLDNNLEKTEQANQLFDTLKSQNVIFPYSIIDLYISSIYLGPTNVRYTQNQIENLTQSEADQFVSLFSLNPNDDLELNKSRILRILNFIGLIIPSDILLTEATLELICENLSPQDLARLKSVNPSFKGCLEQGQIGETVQQKIQTESCKRLVKEGEDLLGLGEITLSLSIANETKMEDVLLNGSSEYIDEYFEQHGDLPKLIDVDNMQEILDTPLVHCSEIIISLPTIIEHQDTKDGGVKWATIKANDGNTIRIGDFLQVWLNNNAELIEMIPEDEPIDDYFGNHIYFERLELINEDDMTSVHYATRYGS